MFLDYDLVLLGGHRDALPLVRQVLAWGGRVGAILPPQGCLLTEDPRAAVAGLQRWQGRPWPEIRQRTEWAAGWDDRLAFWQGLGVDAVIGTAQFLGPRRLMAADRLWRSRFYAWVPEKPAGEAPTWTLSDLWAQTTLPQTLAIVGTEAVACGLARALPGLGVQVHLVGRRTYLLRDTEGDRFLQAYLRSLGVTLHLGQPVTAVAPGRVWVGDRPWAVERVLVPSQPPWLTGTERAPLWSVAELSWRQVVFWGGRSRGRRTVVPGTPPFVFWQRRGRVAGPLRTHNLSELAYGRIVSDRRGLWQIEALGEAAPAWVAWLGEGTPPPVPGDRLPWENWLALRRAWAI
ncbi:MAG: NAD-binding protein [Pseudanabaenaceae cyanobacterium]